ncbi:hypothetical protein [Methylobacterium nodulans]|uniref:Uncharacterized protein n=1 Tax=Methylobacterium nodulans (strain LMG 21967 / CNCM I-2342 / ORS 2060) TaxID=460265 RepID=B8IV85_METNO|nr:hypothetical protein [Methylobacterium nodulans]ACL60936.1 hypothetical protein Mnod_6112 [Methylobacterium nodulans ORS 2060]
MNRIASFIGEPKNREILSWIGGGLVALAAGTWAVVTYVWPAHDPSSGGKSVVCAQQGSVAGGRDASHNTIIYNGAAPQGAGNTASCADAGQK